MSDMKCSLYRKSSSLLSRSHGVTLIEMMVAILVLSIGLLGIAGLQAATSKYQINTWARSSASMLLSDLSERVRVNADAAGTSFAEEGVTKTSLYLIGDTWNTQQSDALTISKNCETSACTSTERATYDLLIWRQRVRAGLPQGAAWIEGNRRDGLDVTMMWFDKENLDKASTDTTAALVAARVCDGTETGMAQQSCCPEDAAVPDGARCIRFSFIP